MKAKEKSQLMGMRALGPFFTISFGLIWGIALLMILFSEQLVSSFGEIDTTNPLYILAVYKVGLAGVFLVLRFYGLRGLLSYPH